jgi:DNA-binding response OmpR family regulator
MTAKVQASELVYYKQIGAADVICKPFDPMRLPELLETIWNYA